MQQEIDNEIWIKKDKRSAKQTGWNCASDLISAFAKMGFYKTLEEAKSDLIAVKNMIIDDIYPDINLSDKPVFHQPKNIPRIEDTCKECGKIFSPGELNYQKNHPEDTSKLCYKCKKEAGLVE